MNDKDRMPFFELVANVHAFYSRDFSEYAGMVWWEAMKPFDLPAVQAAFNRHCINPDTGQFMPKPADLVRVLQGGTQDQAAMAWAKVDRAIRHVGTWDDVAFDDSLIHRVVADLGGWTWLGRQKEDDWPFVAKRFETLYRGYRIRNERPVYPPVLQGLASAGNVLQGYVAAGPVLVGAPGGAERVMAGGGAGVGLQLTRRLRVGPGVIGLGGEGR